MVILDEATRALPREELARFHRLLRTVVADGTSVLMVSHNLSEVLRLADRVTVLRDGAVAAAGVPTAGLTEHDLARTCSAGPSSPSAGATRHPGSSEVAARVEGLCADTFGPVTFQVAPGEVVGLTGLPGSGFEAIAQLVTGGRSSKGRHLDHPARQRRPHPSRRHPGAWRSAPHWCPRSASSRASPSS